MITSASIIETGNAGTGQRNIVKKWTGSQWEFYGYINGIISFQSTSNPNVGK
jgi:hypothetical protein